MFSNAEKCRRRKSGDLRNSMEKGLEPTLYSQLAWVISDFALGTGYLGKVTLPCCVSVSPSVRGGLKESLSYRGVLKIRYISICKALNKMCGTGSDVYIDKQQVFWVVEMDDGEITGYSCRILYRLENFNHFNVEICIEKPKLLYSIHFIPLLFSATN